MPTVSIITAAYNAGLTIAETIRSVQAQTHTDWEMLIADDGSTDETPSIVRGFASRDSRITLIQLPRSTKPGQSERTFFGLLPKPRTRSSQAHARNAALQAARARFVAFVDADDIWLPAKLERQLAFTIQCGAMVTYCQYRRFRSDPSRPGPIVVLPSSFTHRSLCGNTAIAGALTVMIDTSLSGPIEFPDAPHEDLCLWLRLLRGGKVAQGLREDLCRYRVSANSSSGNKFRSAAETWYVLRHVEALPMTVASWCFLQYAWRSVLRRTWPLERRLNS